MTNLSPLHNDNDLQKEVDKQEKYSNQNSHNGEKYLGDLISNNEEYNAINNTLSLVLKNLSYNDTFDTQLKLLENRIKAYTFNAQKSNQYKTNIYYMQDLIKENKKVLFHTLKSGGNQKNNYYDDNWVTRINRTFTAYGIDIHFKNSKNLKGNILQVLNLVDDLIEKINDNNSIINKK